MDKLNLKIGDKVKIKAGEEVINFDRPVTTSEEYKNANGTIGRLKKEISAELVFAIGPFLVVKTADGVYMSAMLRQVEKES